ncbi:hypothetical protein [Amycolatopsis nivea]|uniref:hypothetical protein n=1 Tax=Amycolatopsis nivea TaxID=1644109 RepID=UPI00106F1E5F|nr:hypothetical protein [Amycolatopsis nivea]
MSEPLAAALIPPDSPRIVSGHAAPPPMAPLSPTYSAAAWTYSVASMDASGRLATRAALKALGWAPGTPLTLTVWRGAAVLFRRDPNGAVTVGHSLRVQVPAGLRSRCALRTGDQVLLAHSQKEDALLVYTLPLLEQVLSETHECIISGGE